ncbi:hypothetical protein ILP97_44640 [Amycolatopsis sp. H6(2020)]|nr:hypothetical protein [Amycolatopsis sp. H6(2020)]
MTTYTPERKDTMLRMAVELAAEYDMSGVELLHAIVGELNDPTSSKSHATDLFYELFDRDIEIGDYAEFASVVRSLIEYAGDWDEDLYND